MLYPGNFLRRDLALTFFKAQLPKEPQKQQYSSHHILGRVWREVRGQRTEINNTTDMLLLDDAPKMFADIEREIAMGAHIEAQQAHDLAAAYYGDPA